MMKRIILFLIMGLFAYGQEEQLSLYDNTVQKKSYNVPFTNAVKEPDYGRLANQTKAAALLSLASMGVLYALPEDFTGWGRFDLKTMGSKHRYNLTDRGAVWDPDNIFFNFMAHPYVGATYYIAARKSGFNEFDSFMYSFCMSAFLWEIGMEAFEEAPSIQDIVVTPGAGAIIGEYLFGIENKIIRNNGKVLDSRILGRVSLILIDPIGTVANIMGYKDDTVMGSWTFAKAKNESLQLGYSLQVKF